LPQPNPDADKPDANGYSYGYIYADKPDANGYSYGNHHTTSNSYTNGNGDEYAKANAKAAADTASSAVRIG
jgi:hypothetical protein